MPSIELPAQVDENNVKEFVKDKVWPLFEDERHKLARIAEWASGNQPEYLVPAKTSTEKRALLKLAKSPWAALVVETFTRALYVDGFRTRGGTDNVQGPWQTWVANGFHDRWQPAIHRSAVTYGYCFARALKGNAPDGANQAQLRGLSPSKCFPLYEDPANDIWAKYALEIVGDGTTVRFYDDSRYFDIPMPRSGEFPKDGKVQVFDHGTGEVPIVRYRNSMDLDGRIRGEIERLIPVASRLDKTLFDRLLTQHFASWKVRWATGLDTSQAEDPDAFLDQLAQDSVLAATSKDAKFGTLDASALDGFIRAYESDLATLEATAQLPPNWSGGVSNVGPEGLSSARANTKNKLYEMQLSLGSSHNQLLRLAAHIEGDEAAAADFHASVTWQDTEIRSLGQLTDAMSKLHLSLGVPAKALWRKITTEEEAQIWESYFDSEDESDLESKYWAINTNQPTPDGEGASAPQPNAEPTQTT